MITDLTSICFFKILSDIRVRNLLQKMRMYLFRSVGVTMMCNKSKK